MIYTADDTWTQTGSGTRQCAARRLLEAHENRGENCLELPHAELTLTGVSDSIVALYKSDRSAAGGRLLIRWE